MVIHARIPAAGVRKFAASTLQHRHPHDPSLAEKFNLASLNGGKNPFQVSSNQLLKGTFGKKNVQTDRHVKEKYSLAYLMGNKEETTTIGKVQKPRKNPFEVVSDKLM